MNENEEVEELKNAEEQTDIEYIREKYENEKAQKADEIISLQIVICILLVITFLILSRTYTDLCQDLYNILRERMKDTGNIVPYISEYL